MHYITCISNNTSVAVLH